MKRIFLIDDDIDDRDMFSAALKNINNDIDYVEAKDGQEALEMITDANFTPPDIFFVDLNMPRITGLEFVIRMKKMARYADVPTYIYTTSNSPREKINCIAAGATGYIIKQVNRHLLQAELSKLILKKEESAA